MTDPTEAVPSADGGMPAWTSDSHIEPSWLDERLTDLPRVKKCEATDISNDSRRGDVPKNGATLLLHVAFEGCDGDGDSKTTTTTLVAKQVPPSGLALSQRLGLAREARFYKELAPRIRPSDDDADADAARSIPKIYYSHGDMDAGSKFVVMEDLSDGFVDSGILFGPGNPNNWNRDLKRTIGDAYPSGNAPASYEVAHRTFLAVARVHASFWRDSSLLDGESGTWLRGAGWIDGTDEGSWRASMDVVRGMWNKYTEEGGGKEGDVEWDPLLRKIVEKSVEGISWEAQKEQLNAESHYCLVHGDFWPGNVMISTDRHAKAGEKARKRDLRLLDWEMVGVGSGPQELGQYVISNMEPAARRACEERLVRNYYDELVELGVEGFSWEECWSEYTVGGLERWLWFLAYFCGRGMGRWAQFFHDQMKEFVRDHGIRPEDVTQPRP